MKRARGSRQRGYVMIDWLLLIALFAVTAAFCFRLVANAWAADYQCTEWATGWPVP
jgi:TRAP-type C4-dicarboxylate transport system permease small subunit